MRGCEGIQNRKASWRFQEILATKHGDIIQCTKIRIQTEKQPTSTRILMNMRLDEVVASSLSRIDSKQVHGSASVYRRCAKNLATFLSLLVSSLQGERSVFDVTPMIAPCLQAKHVQRTDTGWCTCGLYCSWCRNIQRMPLASDGASCRSAGQ